MEWLESWDDEDGVHHKPRPTTPTRNGAALSQPLCRHCRAAVVVALLVAVALPGAALPSPLGMRPRLLALLTGKPAVRNTTVARGPRIWTRPYLRALYWGCHEGGTRVPLGTSGRTYVVTF